MFHTKWNINLQLCTTNDAILFLCFNSSSNVVVVVVVLFYSYDLCECDGTRMERQAIVIQLIITNIVPSHLDVRSSKESSVFLNLVCSEPPLCFACFSLVFGGLFGIKGKQKEPEGELSFCRHLCNPSNPKKVQ